MEGESAEEASAAEHTRCEASVRAGNMSPNRIRARASTPVSRAHPARCCHHQGLRSSAADSSNRSRAL